MGWEDENQIIENMHGVLKEREGEVEKKFDGCESDEERKRLKNDFANQMDKANRWIIFCLQGKNPRLLDTILYAHYDSCRKINSIYQESIK